MRSRGFVRRWVSVYRVIEVAVEWTSSESSCGVVRFLLFGVCRGLRVYVREGVEGIFFYLCWISFFFRFFLSLRF